MNYCEKHLKKEKGSVVSEVILMICAIPFAFLGIGLLCTLVYELIAEHAYFDISGVIFALLFSIAFLAIGIACVWGARSHRKKRLAINADVENSSLIQSIRAQMPPEQAKLSVPELFALVDKDLTGGQTFSSIDLGRTWALIGDRAVLLRSLQGIFLKKRVHTGSKVTMTVFEVWIFDHTSQGMSVTFPRKGSAKQCCEALAAAAPQAQTGGSKEEEAFLKARAEQAKA